VDICQMRKSGGTGGVFAVAVVRAQSGEMRGPKGLWEQTEMEANPGLTCIGLRTADSITLQEGKVVRDMRLALVFSCLGSL
jgi:hypothetical protein